MLGGDGLTYSNVDQLNLSFAGSNDVLNVLSTDAAVTTSAAVESDVLEDEVKRSLPADFGNPNPRK